MVRDSELPVPEAQVPSLVWKLRFHMLLQAAPPQKNHKAKMRHSLSFRCKKPDIGPRSLPGPLLKSFCLYP